MGQESAKRFITAKLVKYGPRSRFCSPEDFCCPRSYAGSGILSTAAGSRILRGSHGLAAATGG
jgi:hypothetical protein